ncbi:MAG TPA: hypothetical protein VLU25_00935 [Acidobacteriota bacterium]|nr:hypothetical protein [Acidobacteriota bacterium]
MADKEFYIGFQEKAPPGIASFLRTRVALLLLIAVLLGAGLAMMQSPFAASFFDFGNLQTWKGRLAEAPVPSIVVAGEDGKETNVPLVHPGKFGAEETVSGRDGQAVELRATLIQRGLTWMLEAVPGSVRPAALDAALPLPHPQPLGEWALVGEIVDSKCYLGVMNPGRGKVHKSCAINCIRGGIPPLLRIGSGDRQLLLLLLDSQGQPVNQAILDRIGVPVRVNGEVERHGNWLVIKASPSNIRRLRR